MKIKWIDKFIECLVRKWITRKFLEKSKSSLLQNYGLIGGQRQYAGQIIVNVEKQVEEQANLIKELKRLISETKDKAEQSLGDEYEYVLFINFMNDDAYNYLLNRGVQCDVKELPIVLFNGSMNVNTMSFNSMGASVFLNAIFFKSKDEAMLFKLKQPGKVEFI